MKLQDPSAFFRALLMSVGFAYPVRFVCSFGLSTLIYLLIASLAIDYPSVSILKIITENPKLFILSLSTVIAFWPALLSKNLRPDRMGSLIDSLSDIIDRSNLSSVQRSMIWRSLADRIINQTDVDDPLSSEKIKELARDVSQEQGASEGGDPLLPG